MKGRALGWLLLLAGFGVLVAAVLDLAVWAQTPFGWFRVVVEGVAAGALLAPGALLSQGIELEHRIAWVQATVITAAVSGVVLGWVAGMAVGARLGWPGWTVHVGAAVAVLVVTVGSVWASQALFGRPSR